MWVERRGGVVWPFWYTSECPLANKVMGAHEHTYDYETQGDAEQVDSSPCDYFGQSWEDTWAMMSDTGEGAKATAQQTANPKQKCAPKGKAGAKQRGKAKKKALAKGQAGIHKKQPRKSEMSGKTCAKEKKTGAAEKKAGEQQKVIAKKTIGGGPEENAGTAQAEPDQPHTESRGSAKERGVDETGVANTKTSPRKKPKMSGEEPMKKLRFTEPFKYKATGAWAIRIAGGGGTQQFQARHDHVHVLVEGHQKHLLTVCPR